MQVYLYINHHYSNENEAVFFLDGFWCREKNTLFFYSIYHDPIKKAKYILRKKEEQYNKIKDLLGYYDRKTYQNVTAVRVPDIGFVFPFLGKRSEYFFNELKKYKRQSASNMFKPRKRKHLQVIYSEDIHYTEDEMNSYLIKEDPDYRYFVKWENIYNI